METLGLRTSRILAGRPASEGAQPDRVGALVAGFRRPLSGGHFHRWALLSAHGPVNDQDWGAEERAPAESRKPLTMGASGSGTAG